MNRRTYFKTLLAACAAPQLPALEPLPATNGKLKIAAVEIWRLEGHRRRPTRRAGNHRPALGCLRRPPSEPRRRYAAGQPIPASAMYIKIKTDAGSKASTARFFPTSARSWISS